MQTGNMYLEAQLNTFVCVVTIKNKLRFCNITQDFDIVMDNWNKNINPGSLKKKSQAFFPSLHNLFKPEKAMERPY